MQQKVFQGYISLYFSLQDVLKIKAGTLARTRGMAQKFLVMRTRIMSIKMRLTCMNATANIQTAISAATDVFF